jgi:hypothetical protein
LSRYTIMCIVAPTFGKPEVYYGKRSTNIPKMLYPEV